MKDSCWVGGYEDKGGVRRVGDDFMVPLAVVIGRKPLEVATPAGEPGAEDVRPPPLLAFLLAVASEDSRFSAFRRHFMPFPGSSGRLAIFSKLGFKERL